MDFTYIADGIDAVVIDNFYTEEQLQDIMTELKWLTRPPIMKDADELSPASESKEILTVKKGVFLEDVFKDWKHSALISHGVTQTTCEEFNSNLLKFNTMFKSLLACNYRYHLLSYYENSSYYKPHVDGFFYTILNYFHIEPKQFEGGDIVLYSCNSSKKVNIEPKNNRAVVILSCTLHEAMEVKSNVEKQLSGIGRYCNAMFITYKDPKVNTQIGNTL